MARAAPWDAGAADPVVGTRPGFAVAMSPTRSGWAAASPDMADTAKVDQQAAVCVWPPEPGQISSNRIVDLQWQRNSDNALAGKSNLPANPILKSVNGGRKWTPADAWALGLVATFPAK